MKRIIEQSNKTIAQLIDNQGIIEALKRLKCNDRLSFISADYKIGKGTQIYYFVNIIGKGTIGENCLIASYTEIQDSAVIGNSCRIGSHSFICKGVELGNSVFLGSHVKFINDRLPRAFNKNYKLEKIIVEDDVSIGSGCTIMCGITIGKGAVIGAHSFVNKNVPPGEIFAGSPAKYIRNACK